MKKVDNWLIRVALLCIALFSDYGNQTLAAESDHRVISTLSGEGFENLRRVETSEEVVYTIENNVYKLQTVGVSKALSVISEGDSCLRSKICTVIFTDTGIPKLSMTNAGHCWTASNCGYSRQWDMAKGIPCSNSTFGNLDLSVYPQLYYKNVIINQLYYYLLEISPALELSLWRGSKFTAQVIFPVLNDGYKNEYRNIRPGYLTFVQNFSLPYCGWGDVRLGTFDTRTFGAETNFTFPLHGRHLYLNGKAACVGIGLFPDFKKFYYSGDCRFYYSVGPDYYSDRYNVLLSLRAERYLQGETGVKAEMFRHFKYCSVGFYAQKAWKRGADIHLNGGFRVYVSLPPYRYKRSGVLPRITTGLSTGTTYNAGNERTYYYMPVTTADDNPLKRNQFNALYIQSFLNAENY